MSKPVTIYLIHFDERYKHAQHYLGVTRQTSVEDRIKQHQTGRGARLMAVVTKAGIPWRLVRIWENAPRFAEMKMKGRSLARYCPVCCGRKTGTIVEIIDGSRMMKHTKEPIHAEPENNEPAEV